MCRLEEASGVLQLLQAFDLWCEKVSLEQATAKAQAPVEESSSEGVALDAPAPAPTTSCETGVPGVTSSELVEDPASTANSKAGCSMACEACEDERSSDSAKPQPDVSAPTLNDVAAAADGALAAVNACSSALQPPHLPLPPSATPDEALPEGAEQDPTSNLHTQPLTSEELPKDQDIPAKSNAEAPASMQPLEEPATVPAPTPELLPEAPRSKRTEPRAQLESYTQGLACSYLQGEMAYLDYAVRLAMVRGPTRLALPAVVIQASHCTSEKASLQCVCVALTGDGRARF